MGRCTGRRTRGTIKLPFDVIWTEMTPFTDVHCGGGIFIKELTLHFKWLYFQFYLKMDF